MEPEYSYVTAETAARLGDLRRLAGLTQERLAEALEIHPNSLGERERGVTRQFFHDAEYELNVVEGLWQGVYDDYREQAGWLRRMLEAGVAAEEQRARLGKWTRRKRVVVDGHYMAMLGPLREAVGISRVDLARAVGLNEKVIWERENERVFPAPSRLLPHLEALTGLVEERAEAFANESAAFRRDFYALAEQEA